ncbi:hypothetical protein K4F52_002335 [Lecanicillium sp. MT-2017a]|nr:hypothetical protein K4F52_002335 [Lecanicillium sp. MT-2017a]
MLLSLPRRPIVYVKGQEVLDRNGASLLSNVFFSYNFLSRKTASSLSAKLALEDVPLPDYTLRSGPLQEQFVKFSGAGRLWLQLLWSLLAPLSKQWLFVIIKAASELSSRHALFQLLRGLEFSGASVESQWGPLTWAICMGLALLSTAVADGWLYWVTTGELLTSATSILQTAIYDKVTVRKNVHGGPRDEKKLAAAAHQDVGDKLFSDT